MQKYLYAHVYVYIRMFADMCVHAYMYTYVHVAYAHNVTCDLHVWCVYMCGILYTLYYQSHLKHMMQETVSLFS